MCGTREGRGEETREGGVRRRGRCQIVAVCRSGEERWRGGREAQMANGLII
jgi:hypothetical protein